MRSSIRGDPPAGGTGNFASDTGTAISRRVRRAVAGRRSTSSRPAYPRAGRSLRGDLSGSSEHRAAGPARLQESVFACARQGAGGAYERCASTAHPRLSTRLSGEPRLPCVATLLLERTPLSGANAGDEAHVPRVGTSCSGQSTCCPGQGRAYYEPWTRSSAERRTPQGQDTSHVISGNGSRIFWSAVEDVHESKEQKTGPKALYVRVNDTQPQSPLEEAHVYRSRRCLYGPGRRLARVGPAPAAAALPDREPNGEQVFFTDEQHA